MLSGRSDFKDVPPELLREALAERRKLRAKWQNIPDQYSPRAYALKQAGLELNVRMKNGQVYSFVTLKKYYDGTLPSIAKK